MYDELMKSLRICARAEREYECDGCAYRDKGFDCNSIMENEAADAIEGLIEVIQNHDFLESLIKPDWIPVTERLPDQNSGNLYICLIVGGEYDQLSWYELCDFAEGQFWTQDQLYEGHVTHWMPLPEPPMEDKP